MGRRPTPQTPNTTCNHQHSTVVRRSPVHGPLGPRSTSRSHARWTSAAGPSSSLRPWRSESPCKQPCGRQPVMLQVIHDILDRNAVTIAGAPFLGMMCHVQGGVLSYDQEAFRAVQSRLAEWWPMLTVRTMPSRPRVLVMVNSLPPGLPAYLRPMLPSYEERALCHVMALARNDHTRVIYVTSMPMLPRLASYYLDLLADLTPPEAAERLALVSVSDSSDRPLVSKILDRPLLLQRLRALIGDTRYGLLMPYSVGALEAELAVALDIPVYGPDPGLAHLGSKSGSREVFAAAGVAMARGMSGLRDRGDVVDALHELRNAGLARKAAIKTEYGFSGQGNAVIDLSTTHDRASVNAALDRLLPDDSSLSTEAFLERF